MKTFVLDLSRIVNGSWYCGSKACTMGQFAEQECNLPKDFYKKDAFDKAEIALKACQLTLGEAATDEIITINDGKGSWKNRVKKIRKILNSKGWRLVVKGKKL